MKEEINQTLPEAYTDIDKETKASGFTMASELPACALLRVLAASKPSGKFLELGTGTGLATSWILDGMDESSTLISIDNDNRSLSVAKRYLAVDKRATFIQTDGEAWITKNKNEKFDYIFADTWHGKYLLLDETLSMLNRGGLYIIDDMLPQLNWPDGHEKKVEKLIADLEARKDLLLTKQNWSSGIIIAVKNNM
ncbi:MAG: class I SAM-dependent methyltransferase [Chitinophagaceae bacterium]|nr:class I SAM-dependent methyltransferase [Chitinophagaceae bacterium]